MNVEERLLDNGYEDVVFFINYSYDDALIGVTDDNRAVYDYNKMVEWLVKEHNFTDEEAIDWINFNTLRSLPYIDNAPIIMFPLEDI